MGIRPILPKLLDLTDQRIRDMDAAGVTTAILSASLGVEQLPEDEGCLAATASTTRWAPLSGSGPTVSRAMRC